MLRDFGGFKASSIQSNSTLRIADNPQLCLSKIRLWIKSRSSQVPPDIQRNGFLGACEFLQCNVSSSLAQYWIV